MGPESRSRAGWPPGAVTTVMPLIQKNNNRLTADIPDDLGTMNADITRVLAMPDVRERLLGMGSTPVGGTSEEFGAYVKQEIARWGKVVRDSNTRLD